MPKPSLMVAPNGARKQKSDHNKTPITISEITDTAYECFHAGADILHLHIRDDDGQHSLDPVLYKETIAAVQSRIPQMPIQITTESAGIFDVPTQYKCLQDVQPKAASISVREIARDENIAPHLYKFCAETDVEVQHILYNTDDIALLTAWFDKGWIPKAMTSVIFVLGQYQPMVLAQPSDLSVFLDATAKLALDWTVCAFGKNELACAKEALRLGGNIRIGFENNIHTTDGTLLVDNAQSVSMAAELIKDMQHEQGIPTQQ